MVSMMHVLYHATQHCLFNWEDHLNCPGVMPQLAKCTSQCHLLLLGYPEATSLEASYFPCHPSTPCLLFDGIFCPLLTNISPRSQIVHFLCGFQDISVVLSSSPADSHTPLPPLATITADQAFSHVSKIVWIYSRVPQSLSVDSFVSLHLSTTLPASISMILTLRIMAVH